MCVYICVFMNIALLQSSFVAASFLGSNFTTSKNTLLFVGIKLLGKWLSKDEERKGLVICGSLG